MAKGHKTGGRVKGSANKTTTDVRALASKYNTFCIDQLAKIAKCSKNEYNRLAALEQLLNRANGKPVQASTLANPDNTPLTFTLTLGND